MNSFKDLKLKKHYDSDHDNLLYDFFVPTLGTTKNYKRLAGFFSSGILSAAARGILGLIENDGHMQLMVGATLHLEDLVVAEDAQNNPEKYLEKIMVEELDAIADMLSNDHLEALGWMLANNLLEIKVGIVRDGGLFHLKVGVMEDRDGNKLSFSGSDNETPSGWKYNIEEFKVFRAWIDEEKDYFMADEEKFDRFWSGIGTKVKTIPLPDAVKRRLIDIAPKKKDGLRLWQAKHNDVTDQKSSPPINIIKKARDINLFPHQIKAISAIDDHKGKGILAMATGSGKTITALSYSKKIAEFGPLCTIVAVPYAHLVRQWIDKDILDMFPGVPIVEVHGEAGDWRRKLKLLLHGFSNRVFKQIFIVGIYGSLANNDFIKILEESNISSDPILYIADEVHNSGAQESKRGLLDMYYRRIGLSATPGRYFDEEGTDLVLKYFGGIVYEYGIADAIKDGFLTSYKYYPVAVELRPEEYEKYAEISKRISKRIAMGHNDNSEIIHQTDAKRLLIERSRILKNASGKVEGTRDIVNRLLSEYGNSGLSHMLIYCDNLKQVDSIQEILNELNIINHKFTEKEGFAERQEILKNFSNGTYKVLVSVKCLDEGVDIPEAHIAIIVASTTNPREYIQRRGRVLRKKSFNKNEAIIFDLFVTPPPQLIDGSDKLEKAILEREFSRIRDFVDTSNNPSDSYAELLAVMKKFGIYL